MLAKFMRFYSMSDLHVLAMPVQRFLMLSRKMRQIEAEESLRALVVQHHDKPGDYSKELIGRMESDGRKRKPGAENRTRKVELPITPGVAQMESEPGFVERERARQKAAAEQLKAQQEEWKRQRLLQQQQQTTQPG